MGITVRVGVWSSVASNPRAIASVAQVFGMEHTYTFVSYRCPPSPLPHTHTQHHYGINHVTLPTKIDREDLTHLLSSHLSVDVYDGDSLILLGTAALPLRVR